METDQLSAETAAQVEALDRDGFVVLDNLLSTAEVETYRAIYDRFLSGEIDAGSKRSDLGAGAEPATPGTENITQIMWPSLLCPELADLPLHARGLELARQLIGQDAELDFDMLIDKAPRTNTATPWHQDAGYWVNLPDGRAVSIWVSLDEATLDSGCMWYVQGSHRGPVRPHRSAGKGGGAIECEGSEDEPGATPVPLQSRRGGGARREDVALLPRQHHQPAPTRVHPELPARGHDRPRTGGRHGPREDQQRTRRPEHRGPVT